MSIISISGLTKSYGKDKGVFDLNLNIERGEVFGYLGPNGAGKTTTIRHLLGLLNPQSGRCLIDGLDCRTKSAEIQRIVGYLPGEIAFFDNMRGSEFLTFMADMRGMKSTNGINRLLDYFELDPSGKIKRMSKGMKQKIGLVCAFMHDPQVLILDEPTSGLDPLMQSKFIDYICKEKERGKTILMSSHSFEEVERTCDRVGIIRKGRLIANETVSSLKETGRKIFNVTVADEHEAAALSASGLNIISKNGFNLKIAISGSPMPLISALSQRNVTALSEVSQSLEEIFMHYYGGELDD